MIEMKTLFKKTSTGATQVWYREVDGNKYRSISGQLNGALVTSGWSTAEPKNVGRSNATTAEWQAALECDAAYVKKLAQGGYHESVLDIDETKFFKPMLAKGYEDRPIQPSEWGKIFSQPKLDGIRCIATQEGLFTRQGKPIDACPHISEALLPLFGADPDLILDGELYADKLAEDFNKIISLVRKKNPNAAALKESKETVEYHIYDLPSLDGKFEDRLAGLHSLLGTKLDMIQLVPTNTVVDQDGLDTLNSQYLSAGYEGQMIRRNGPYKNGRSFDLLKRKVFLDKEYTIVSINEGDGNRAGMAGYITYELGDGRQFGSGIKGSHEYCIQLLKDADKYCGGEGTVRYFQLTPDGVPRFPVTIAVFEGKRDS